MVSYHFVFKIKAQNLDLTRKRFIIKYENFVRSCRKNKEKSWHFKPELFDRS